MSQTILKDTEIFDGGPPLRLEKSLGLIKPDQRRSLQRAILAALIVWAPLPVLAALQGLALGENKLESLMADFAVHARYLIATPLLIIAEPFTLPLLAFKYVIGALVAVILFLFVGPLLAFSRQLIQARRRGIFEYGALASAVGSQLERRWVERVEGVDEGTLDVQHFSATTDLYQVVSNVYQMKAIPVDLQDLIAVIITVLLPFLPILLYEVSFEVILGDLVKLLF